jgi:nucleoside-diphosphate-sugar epimerase
MDSRVSARYACVIVTGASSQVGRFLLPLLSEAGHETLAISRDPDRTGAPPIPRVKWIRADITKDLNVMPPARPAALIHTAPIWVSPRFAEGLRADRIIAFSSTSALTKAGSASPKEREVARILRESETALAQTCAKTNAPLTIFRPTMIYGAGMDMNVTSIARFIKTARLFPMIGAGSGLRQPVHAEDLARACVTALENPASFGKTYNLGGGETLAYREMVERIFRGLGLTPRVIRMPAPIFRTALKMASVLPHFSHLTPEMADRMNEDMTFDNSKAAGDFGYSPRPFTFTPDDVVGATRWVAHL